MTNEELTALVERGTDALMRIPGVLGTGFGYKETSGVISQRLSFLVFVERKCPATELPEDQLIPESIEGYPTDVLNLPDPVRIHCQDMTQHSKLMSGISITDFKQGPSGYGAGTLGFFATVNGLTGPKNVVLVSNNHVIAAKSELGDDVCQPLLFEQANGQVTLDLSADKRNVVAKLYNKGMDGFHPFAYSGEAQLDYSVDAATALLDISVSSWCDVNCGVSYKNEVRELAVSSSNKIADVTRLVATDAPEGSNYIVYKVGRRTSRTVGKIVSPVINVTHPTDPSKNLRNVMIIAATGPDCENILRFADEGDSGAAILNQDRKLIGLLFAIDGTTPNRAYACHIHPVLDLLNITAITEANPPVGPAGKALVETSGSFDGGTRESIALRDRLKATPKGADYHARIRQHAQEVVELVNHCRPVTVAWHRSKGPVWFGHFSNNLRDPDHAIPFEVDGIARQAVIARMAEVLCVHGSTELQATIAAYRAEADALADSFDDLRQLAERFEAEALEASHERA